ncbi:MAG: hypothetical protein NUW37_07630 [Planctomycetes bacterium]|nr:hypothetical protein [Planctomycetota bacterium]
MTKTISNPTLEEIQKAIEKLSPESFEVIRKWIADRDFERWDKKIEEDSSSGKFDALIDEVLQEESDELEDL